MDAQVALGKINLLNLIKLGSDLSQPAPDIKCNRLLPLLKIGIIPYMMSTILRDYKIQGEDKLNMNFKSIFIYLFIIFLFVSPPSSMGQSKSIFELKVSGGLVYIAGGDFNRSAEGWSDLRKQNAELYGNSFTSENNLLDWGQELSGEVIFNLNPQFALSAGLGYIPIKSSGKDTTTKTDSIGTSTFENTVSAVPITLGLYYYIPISLKSRLSIGGGASYYFVSFDHKHYREDGLGWWIRNNRNGSGSGIGFQGRIGFEYSVSQSVAILVEGLGRYAKTDGFEGIRERSDSNNWSDSADIGYYFVEREQPGFGWFPRVVGATEEPTGSEVRNVRSAAVDFSGFTIRIGLKIRLF